MLYISAALDPDTARALGGDLTASETGTETINDVVREVMQQCKAHEGNLCKFIVEDRGFVFVISFGIPPLMHTDDPARALFACLDISSKLGEKGWAYRCALTTGQNYCGTVGTPQRTEFTVVGKAQRAAAGLLALLTADPDGAGSVVVDRSTKEACIEFATFAPYTGSAAPASATSPIASALTFVASAAPGPEGDAPPRLERFKVLGVGVREALGIQADKRIRFPWNCASRDLGGSSNLLSMTSYSNAATLEGLLEGLPQKHPGLVILQGEDGMGKTELAESALVTTFRKFDALPVFASDYGYAGQGLRPLQEILKSLVASFRYIGDVEAGSDKDALISLAEAEYQESIRLFEEDLGILRTFENVDAESAYVDLALKLLRRLLAKQPVTCVLRVCPVTSYKVDAVMTASARYDRSQDSSFWKLAEKLCDLANTKGQGNSFVVVLSISAKEELPRQIEQLAKETIQTDPFSDAAAVEEYISHHLGVPQEEVPVSLRDFVAEFACGNAMACRETLECLLRYEHIEVTKDELGKPHAIGCFTELGDVDLEGWAEKASMVADAVCLLESLEPVQNMVVKMMATFTGTASVADLAASACPRHAGGLALDRLLLLTAVQDLWKRGILEASDPTWSTDRENELWAIACFRLSSKLLQKVGFTLVSSKMRNSVKRQALIDRVLTKTLAGRLQEARMRKAIPHVPWYYQIDQKDIPSVLKKSHDATR
jgi:hypothetical protein